ncbi:MAG TPA: AEC family transporter [Anaerolineales bacterium]|jgi:predicted permease|nr:AEC family transporter [Anaerolineales bacterium]
MDITELLNTFANNLLPILVLSAAGFALGKALSIDSRSLGRVVFYIFSPILVFDLLLNTQLDSTQIFITMSYTVLVCFSVGLLALLLGLLFHLERPVLMAIILTSAFGNTGNYGLPVVSFAFGKDALAFATLFFATTSILFNTVGVLIASLGHMDFKTALGGLFKVPAIYAVALAALLNQFHLVLPIPLARTVDLASSASIPVMIVLLGLELSRVQWSHSFKVIGLSAGLRLLAGPAIGLLLALLFGLNGPARQGAVTEASMPAAVTSTVLATEYGLDTSLVTAIIFIGTILSPLTLTPLLVYLGK